jgi:nucleoside-diphosphate-sugar epimerase
MADRILLTGATGAIAKHCAKALIAAGYTVRGTARDTRRASDVVRAAGLEAGDPRLEIVAADLTRDDGWAEVAAGCVAVLHTASPFPLEQPRDVDAVVRPAREGTLRVLDAARKAGCRRVVLTSSIVAVVYPTRDTVPGAFTEAEWTDPKRTDVTAYVVSKTLAERAAWEFVQGSAPDLELAVINPGLVLGPALDPDLSSSHQLLRMLATGKYPALPRVGYAIADMRDVAAAHVAALTVPQAAGERFLVASGFLTLKEIGAEIVRVLPDLARRVPTMEVPDAMVRMMAMADRNLAAVVPDLGRRREVSSEKSQRVLGLSYHSPQEAVASAAQSLRALKLI